MGWDGNVNPNDESYKDDSGGGERTRWCGEGRKVLAPLGFERWESSKGSQMLSVRFLCLDDLEEGGVDVGAHVWRNFALTEKAVAFFARFARAMGWNDPFNVFRDDDVGQILGSGFVIGRVETETYQRDDGKQGSKSEVKFFDSYGGGEEPGWNTLIAKGEEEWDSYLEWRANNPRGTKKPSARGTPRAGASGGGGKGERRSNMPSHDDDIPF